AVEEQAAVGKARGADGLAAALEKARVYVDAVVLGLGQALFLRGGEGPAQLDHSRSPAEDADLEGDLAAVPGHLVELLAGGGVLPSGQVAGRVVDRPMLVAQKAEDAPPRAARPARRVREALAVGLDDFRGTDRSHDRLRVLAVVRDLALPRQ